MNGAERRAWGCPYCDEPNDGPRGECSRCGLDVTMFEAAAAEVAASRAEGKAEIEAEDVEMRASGVLPDRVPHPGGTSMSNLIDHYASVYAKRGYVLLSTASDNKMLTARAARNLGEDLVDAAKLVEDLEKEKKTDE